MTSTSRRTLLKGSLALPVVSFAATPGLDPVPARVAAWIDRPGRQPAMIRRWQALETELLRAARKRPSGEDTHAADTPVAREMRELDRLIDAGYPALASNAGAILDLPTQSLEGALAKVELGLIVQGPFDWRDYAFELMTEGAA